jgi:tetratricopeptide (TPR) repeat protein
VAIANAQEEQRSFLEQAEERFLYDQPEEAAVLFEAALQEDPGNERIYLYLGICYEQLDRHDEAIEVLQRGIQIADRHHDLLYLNIGNNFFARGEATLAAEMYTKALQENPKLASAYLNRGNSRLKLSEFEAALRDYTLYLTLDPLSDQRSRVEQMIQLLKNMLAEEERKREEEERRRKEEEKRQQALLDEIMNTLSTASEEAQSLSADSEDVEEFEIESDIVD